VLGSLSSNPLEELTTRTESALWKKVIKMLYERLVHMCKALTDLKILGCELHQNAFGGRAPPRPYSAPPAVNRGWGRDRKGNSLEVWWNREGGKGTIGRDGRGRKVREGGGRTGGEGGTGRGREMWEGISHRDYKLSAPR